METLTTLERRYLDHHRAMGSSPKTITHYVNTFLIFHRFLSAQQIEPTQTCLTTVTCNAFAGWLRETPTRPRRGSTQRSVVTTHGHLKDLRAFVRWLYGEELIEQLPKVPIPKLPRTLFPILSDDELTTIFASAQTDPASEIDKRNRALVMFMLDTGVRLAEVASLTPADLYLTDNMAKIWGKGSRERFVFYSSTTAESLRLWLSVRGDDEGSLFWLKPAGVRMVLERIKKETGIPVLHPSGQPLCRSSAFIESLRSISAVTTNQRHSFLAAPSVERRGALN